MHGGIGAFVQMLGRALVADGHSVRVVGMYDHANPAPEYEEDHGVEVWRLRRPRLRLGWLWGRYQVFKTVSKWSRNNEIDLVEIADYAGSAAKWPKLRVPVIARLHGSATYFATELNRKIKKIDYWLGNASLKRANFICSVSHYTAVQTQRAFNLPHDPVAILYNFVETNDSLALQSRSKVNVVFSGTLTWKKGIISLIQAWPSVLLKCKDAQLHVYGKDVLIEKNRLIRQVIIGGLEKDQQDSIRFHGHVPRQEVLSALSTARLGVFPSYAESFGLGPAESMAAACPTIYTERGCGGELVRNLQDGLLINPDAPEEIAEAILRLLQDDILAAELGTAGQQRIRENFSAAVLLPQNIAFYRQCIATFNRDILILQNA